MNIKDFIQRLRERQAEDDTEQPECTCNYFSGVYDFCMPEHDESCPLYQPPQETQQQ